MHCDKRPRLFAETGRHLNESKLKQGQTLLISRNLKIFRYLGIYGDMHVTDSGTKNQMLQDHSAIELH